VRCNITHMGVNTVKNALVSLWRFLIVAVLFAFMPAVETWITNTVIVVVDQQFAIIFADARSTAEHELNANGFYTSDPLVQSSLQQELAPYATIDRYCDSKLDGENKKDFCDAYKAIKKARVAGVVAIVAAPLIPMVLLLVVFASKRAKSRNSRWYRRLASLFLRSGNKMINLQNVPVGFAVGLLLLAVGLPSIFATVLAVAIWLCLTWIQAKAVRAFTRGQLSIEIEAPDMKEEVLQRLSGDNS
jgi:hypothetical protein